MKVKVDNKLNLALFGQQTVKPDKIRYYYQVVGYPDLILVFEGKSYPEWKDDIGVALFNFGNIRGHLVCQTFPKAPARWETANNLAQVTVKLVPTLPPGRLHLLSDVIHKKCR